MSDIILALKPKWANLILEGKKKEEVRRVLPKNLSQGDKCYLYCHGSILGYAVVRGILALSDSTNDWEVRKIAELLHEDAMMGEQEMFEYMRGGKRAGVIGFSEVHRYDQPKPHKGAYPQNFVYVDEQAEREKTMLKVTYKLVETKSFYHIKRVCGGKETSCHRYDKRGTTLEEAQRITDIRNREVEDDE